MFQTPSSSFCMGAGLAPSRLRETSLALGARRRKVTVLSERTSGETSRGGGVCARLAAAANKTSTSGINRVATVRDFKRFTAGQHDKVRCIGLHSKAPQLLKRRPP